MQKIGWPAQYIHILVAGQVFALLPPRYYTMVSSFLITLQYGTRATNAP